MNAPMPHRKSDNVDEVARSLVGSMIRHPAVRAEFRSSGGPNLLPSDELKEVYLAIDSLDGEGEPVTVNAVSTRLPNDRRILVQELDKDAPINPHAEASIAILKDAKRSRNSHRGVAFDKQTNAYNEKHLAAATTPAPEFSDEDLALRFAEKYANSLRYVASWNRWLFWNGTHWKFDVTCNAFDHARAICRATATECVKPNIASALASAKTVSAVVKLAQADRRIAATTDQWDCDSWLLNTPSAVIDLRTGESRAHRQDDYITKNAGIAPDTRCSTPIWTEFLNRVTGGDAALAAFLQRMAGYALTADTNGSGRTNAKHRGRLVQTIDLFRSDLSL